jgi:hypothetical protein
MPTLIDLWSLLILTSLNYEYIYVIVRSKTKEEHYGTHNI